MRLRSRLVLGACLCAWMLAALLMQLALATTAPADPHAAALVRAAKADHIDAIRTYVRDGADIDAQVAGDGTALIVAARRGELHLVDVLIGMGANVDQACPGDGDPLIAATAQGHMRIVRRLVSAGARVDEIVPGDETPLINAVRGGHLRVARYLVEHGADVNLGVMANGNMWRTPLNQARTQRMRDFLRGKGATRDGHAG